MKAKYNRYSIKYRILHWFNTFTIDDIKRAKTYVFNAINELLVALFFFFVIFILPFFFF